MRYKTIMVQLDVDLRAAQHLQFACELALRFDAGLIGFAAAEPRLIDPGDVDGATSVDALAIQTEEIEARLEEREKEFRTMTAGITRVSWRGEIGHPTRLLAMHARAADLIVTGAGTPDLMGNSHRMVKHGALILAAGKPVLLASSSMKTVKGERIVIAWKDTREARRSVSDAMPFLVRAQDVLVTTIEENDSLSGNESVADVARYLIRHGVKALGLTEDVIKILSGQVWGWSREGIDAKHAEELNLNLGDRRLRLALELARQLIGTPRHLSQHPGGFVLTNDRLDDLVPIEPAAMVDRQVIEWDKDDIDVLRFMKVDCLALGMLSCMKRAFDLLSNHKGISLDLASIPAEDPKTYAMIRKADTLGTFQIESRAQMSMLPRIKPRTFYDLVIEVAIVRPGPIQGDMVHPYLRRREGKEDVVYPKPELEKVLGKTLGVPLFQEQAMRVAIECAGFTPGEADKLRRAMATFKHTGGVSAFKEKLVGGMVRNGYEREFAEKTFSQLEGFGSYGFPESHAASFALIAYAVQAIELAAGAANIILLGLNMRDGLRMPAS